MLSVTSTQEGRAKAVLAVLAAWLAIPQLALAQTTSPFLTGATSLQSNIPRTQVTICGAPKAIGIPMTRPINQPHEARPAMARPPATITRMMAIGVSHARMFD